MYAALKYVHICMAAASIGGFVLRGWWMMNASPLLARRSVRVLPHVVDTVFLISGVGMVMLTSVALLQTGWLQTKLALLVAYVLLGTVALKRGRTKPLRVAAFAGAVLTFAYIVGVALAKSPLGWFAQGSG